MSGKQHVDFHRKILLRRRLMTAAKVSSGTAYVPFFGDGDVAADLYGGLTLYGADLDADRIATASARLPDADLRVADCDTWPGFAPTSPLAVGDFDAYSYPYESFRSAWEATEWADSVVLLFTDGQRQAIIRTGHWRHPDGTKMHTPGIAERRKPFNSYYAKLALPYVVETLSESGYRVTAKAFYLRSMQLYFGVAARR